MGSDDLWTATLLGLVQSQGTWQVGGADTCINDPSILLAKSGSR